MFLVDVLPFEIGSGSRQPKACFLDSNYFGKRPLFHSPKDLYSTVQGVARGIKKNLTKKIFLN